MMAHDLHIQTARKDRRQSDQAFLGRRRLPIPQQSTNRPVRPPGQEDQPLRMDLQIWNAYLGRLARRGFQISRADQLHQVLIATLVLSQQNDLVRRRANAPLQTGPGPFPLFLSQAQLHACNRLYARSRGRLGEFQTAKHIVGIGNRYSGHFLLRAQLHQILNTNSPLRQGIGGMNAQMNELSMICHTRQSR